MRVVRYFALAVAFFLYILFQGSALAAGIFDLSYQQFLEKANAQAKAAGFSGTLEPVPFPETDRPQPALIHTINSTRVAINVDRATLKVVRVSLFLSLGGSEGALPPLENRKRAVAVCRVLVKMLNPDAKEESIRSILDMAGLQDINTPPRSRFVLGPVEYTILWDKFSRMLVFVVQPAVVRR